MQSLGMLAVTENNAFHEAKTSHCVAKTMERYYEIIHYNAVWCNRFLYLVTIIND